jgi:hypothetical protein
LFTGTVSPMHRLHQLHDSGRHLPVCAACTRQ